MKLEILVFMFLIPLAVVTALPEQRVIVQMSINPLQCNQNPWQLAEYSGKKAPDERTSIENYLNSEGIKVLSIRIEQKEEIVCTACNCPRGDEVRVLILEKDLDRMLSLGFHIA